MDHPQPRTSFQFFILVMLVSTVLNASRLCGQTMSATQDPEQHQDWGQWKVFNSKYPRILGRARCDYDVQVNGRWSSWWGYQFRTTNQTPVDIVFVVEYGDPSGINKPETPSMITNAPFETIYSGGTEIWGTCSEHTFPKTLKAKVVCAVPTGQDAPCFNDANGNRVADAKPSDLHAAEVGPRGASSPSKTSNGASQTQIAGSVWICGANWNDHIGADGPRHFAESWKLTFEPDGSFTNRLEDNSDGFNIDPGEDKWTQTGNRVSWHQGASELTFAGTVNGNLMVVKMTGGLGGNVGRTEGTLTCKPSNH